MNTWKTRAAMAASTLLAGGLLLATPATASPPLPSSPAIQPGTGLAVYNAAADDGSACIAGWPVHTDTGAPGLLTAGHCDHGGKVSMLWRVSGQYETIGKFRESVVPNDLGETNDIGLIALDTVIPTDPRIVGIRPVTGLAHDLKVGDQLCKFGLASGLTCGPIESVGPDRLGFRARSECGDSGSPVYIRNSDGTATAVGVLTGLAAAKPCTEPSANGDVTVATLVAPYLERWHLNLDFAGAGTAQPVGHGHGR